MKKKTTTTSAYLRYGFGKAILPLGEESTLRVFRFLPFHSFPILSGVWRMYYYSHRFMQTCSKDSEWSGVEKEEEEEEEEEEHKIR